jgi:hypothetical protein
MFDSKAGPAESASDADRRLVEMERLVPDRAELERRPALAAQKAPGDRLEVALVGVFQHDDAARSSHPAKLGQHGPRVGEVVEHPNANRGVEVAVGVRQCAGVAEDDLESPVAGQRLAGCSDVHLGRIEQDDLVVAAVLARKPAEPGPDFDQASASGWKKRPNRHSIAGVLVPSGGPEDIAVAEVFVRCERAFPGGRLEAAGLCQDGLAAPTARRWTAKSSAWPDQPQSHRTTFVRALYSSIR